MSRFRRGRSINPAHIPDLSKGSRGASGLVAAAGFAGGGALVNGILADLFDDRARGRAAGFLYAGVGVMVGVAGPALGQLSRVHDGWRYGFCASGGVTLVFGLLTAVFFHDPGVGAAEAQPRPAGARPGGVFETVMVNDADGSQYPTRAVYVEVTEPERLVWNEAHSGMTTTVTFTDLGGARTEVRIHQVNVPEAFRRPEAQAGFLSSLDRCAAYLGSLQSGSGR